jgi:UDP-GlcNAc:undecaprenyl-phosphate GlcNAc-1-phosphate transferase
VAIRLPVFIYFGFYHTLIRYLTIFDIKKVFNGILTATILLIGFAFLSGLARNGYARGVFFIDWFCLTTLLIGYRLLLKKISQRQKNIVEIPTNHKKQILIWGAGDAGELCLRYLLKELDPDFTIVGFIDDDPKKRGKKIRGITVLGDRHHLEILIQLYKVQEVIIAIYATDAFERQKIYDLCQRLGLKTRMFMLNAKVVSEPDFPLLNFRQTSAQALSGFDHSAAIGKS